MKLHHKMSLLKLDEEVEERKLEFESKAGSQLDHDESIPPADRMNDWLHNPHNRHDDLHSNPDLVPKPKREATPDGKNRAQSWMDEPPVTKPVQQTAMPMCNIGLPDFELSVFDGDPYNWAEWIMDFKNFVHDNPFLTTSQKQGYLKRYLGEIPKYHVFELFVDDRNYYAILRELRGRFGRDSLVIESHIKRVKNIRDVNNPNDLAFMHTSVSKLIQIFRSMGYESDLKSATLLYELVDKLSKSYKEAWGGYILHRGTPCLEKFQTWLTDRVDALRLSGVLSFKPLSTDVKLKTGGSRPGGRGSQSPLVNLFQTPSSGVQPIPSLPGTGSGSASVPEGGGQAPTDPRKKNPVKKKCQFCQGDHYLDECTQFLK